MKEKKVLILLFELLFILIHLYSELHKYLIKIIKIENLLLFIILVKILFN